MRITAGSMRGRVMTVPEIEGLRPTPSRVREALFNILGDIQGFSVLDLFAGSGVIALEALSRGASCAVSVEADRGACQAMQEVLDAWQVQGWDIQHKSLPKGLVQGSAFDFIYADPPYAKGLAEQVPVWLKKQDISFETLVVEESSRTKMKWKEGFVPYKSKRYSETTLYFFQPDIEVGI